MSRSNPRRHASRAIAHAELLETRRLLAGGPDRLVNNNFGSTTTSHFTQSGAVLAAFGDTVVTAFNDSGSNSGGASKFTGFARSTNGGTSFTDGGTLPTTMVGDAGFPAIARDDTSGRIYLATLGFINPAQIPVYRSDTGGASWAAPVNGTPGGNNEIKHWITVDNFAGAGRGNVYLVSRRSGGTAPGIYFFSSTDNGTTYTPTGGTLLTTAVSSNAPVVTVGPDHAVYVFWYETGFLRMRRSTDLGLTFAPAVAVATGLSGGANGDLGLVGIRNDLTTPAAFRTNQWPQVAVHPVSGNLYVTYADNPAGTDKSDVFLTQSTNAGLTWSVPVRVNDDATTTDQWFPTIAVTPGGSHLGVFYYSRQEDPAGPTPNNEFRYYSRIATLSGASTTFAPSSPVSDGASLPEFGRDSVVNVQFAGDYNQAVATEGFFHVVWSDNRSDHLGGFPRKDPNVFYDKIPLAAAPMVTASNFNFATLPQRLSFTFDQDVSGSIGMEDLVVQQLPAGPTVAPNGIGYNFVTNTVTFEFGTPLPDGRFRARLIASGITNPGGTPMAADHVFEFTFLRGDANGDARVNLQDFNILAGNFGQSPRDFTQGDFNYDNTVNLQDFNILAGRFGVSVAPATDARGVAARMRGFGAPGPGDASHDPLDDLLA